MDGTRLRADRHRKIADQLGHQGVDALLLLGTSQVQYAVGPTARAADSSHAHLIRTAAVVTGGADPPHLFTPDPRSAPPELPPDHVHPPLHPDADAGVPSTWSIGCSEVLGGYVPDRLGVDELTGPMLTHLPGLLAGTQLVDASTVLGPAKIIKTADELDSIRWARASTSWPCTTSWSGFGPVSGSRSSPAPSSAGSSSWAPRPTPSIPSGRSCPDASARSFTTNGDVAFPLVTTDRILAEGDVMWVDTGISYHGYASDFGRTWLVSDRPQPSRHQREQFVRWRNVVDAVLERIRPGATGRDLTAAAIKADAGRPPWLRHFYLAHGVGTDSAEMPLVGTDLGPEFDERIVLAPGMVLVLEPVIWDDGECGYRSEDIVAVTDTGYMALSDFPYGPYG